MDVERMLVNKTAHAGAVGKLAAQGVEPKHFEESELRSIYEYMLWHYRQYGQAPSIGALKMRFPSHLFEVVEDSVDFLRDQFFQKAKRRYAVTALRNIAEEIDAGAEDVDEIFLEHARRLARVVPAGNTHRFSDMEQRLEAYLNEGVMLGLQMGIPTFDDITQGIYPADYVTIMGYQGRGKSTLAQWMLHNAYWQAATPMYISLEMGATALLRKWDTMAVNRMKQQMAYQELKQGRLKPSQIEAYRAAAEEVKLRKNDIIIKDVTVDCTVDYVYAEMQRHQPDIVCVDYVTLMKTPKAAGTALWERVQYLTNNLKQVARTTGIPIIGVAQTNRSSAKGMPDSDQVGFGLSIVQDSDLVITLHQDDEMKKNKRMEVALIKNRDGATVEEGLEWDMEHMIFKQWHATSPFTRRTDSTTDGHEGGEEEWKTAAPAGADNSDPAMSAASE